VAITRRCEFAANVDLDYLAFLNRGLDHLIGRGCRRVAAIMPGLTGQLGDGDGYGYGSGSGDGSGDGDGYGSGDGDGDGYGSYLDIVEIESSDGTVLTGDVRAAALELLGGLVPEAA
jgi:hypothetical protein